MVVDDGFVVVFDGFDMEINDSFVLIAREAYGDRRCANRCWRLYEAN